MALIPKAVKNVFSSRFHDDPEANFAVGLLLTPKLNAKKLERLVDHNLLNLEKALHEPKALAELCLSHHKVLPNHRKEAKIDYSLFGTKGWRIDDLPTHAHEALDQMWLLANISKTPATFIQNICAMAAVDDKTLQTGKTFGALFGTAIRAAYDLYYQMLDETKSPEVLAARLCNQIGSFAPTNSDGFAAKLDSERDCLGQYVNVHDDVKTRETKLKAHLLEKLASKKPFTRKRDLLDETDTEDDDVEILSEEDVKPTKKRLKRYI